MDCNSEEESATNEIMFQSRRRIKKFSDSESESDKENNTLNSAGTFAKKDISTDSDSSNDNSKNFTEKSHKSRIKALSNSSSSNSSSDDENERKTPLKNEEQQKRLFNKSNKLRDKYKGLLSSRGKKGDSGSDGCNRTESMVQSSSNKSDSSNSNDEEKSIDKLKQKIKERTKTLKSTIYDPDSSDEETMESQTKSSHHSKKSSKPMRMSAKQAMDNMHKIKSESNRMLREKEVSLPYHRPKALSLKDIMNRRKLAMKNDGTALPIKMNNEQLKQYALSLEERQKEMIELCKSDTEDEAEDVADKTKDLDTDKIIISTENQDKCAKGPQGLQQESEDNDKEHENSSIECAIESNDIRFDIVQDTENIVHVNENKNNTGENQVTNVNNKSGEETDFFMTKDICNENYTKEVDGKDDSNPVIVNKQNSNPALDVANQCTESDSQMISLHFDSEKNDNNTENIGANESHVRSETEREDDISDDDIALDEIDKIIENATILRDEISLKQNVDSPMLHKDSESSKSTPKLLGAPGMVIDLDETDPIAPEKSGVELLKERFIYFATIKTAEELEREKEKRIKPGMQHLKLKQELEEQIAEQRSLEWAKRLENEKQQQELLAVKGDESDYDDDIDKIEAKLEESNVVEEGTSESETELEENDCDMTDKPVKRNPMVDDEASVSDNENDIDDKDEDMEESDGETSDEASSESEEEEESKPRKGRILKAFEDSDDENLEEKNKVKTNKEIEEKESPDSVIPVTNMKVNSNSQDDDLQLAQMQKSFSEDLFTSQESETLPVNTITEELKEQTHSTQPEIISQFSILESTSCALNINLDEGAKVPETLKIICESQHDDETNLDSLVGMCSGSFTQNLVTTQPNKTPQTQEFGDDILALCTGKFYDNQFVSQNESDNHVQTSSELMEAENVEENKTNKGSEPDKTTLHKEDGNILKSIIDELDGPDFTAPKAKYFTGNEEHKKDNEVVNTQIKKRLIIDSDNEGEDIENLDEKRKKKLKKKKPKQRALQISDDEDEGSEEEDFYESEVDDNAEERLVEYDSEENEVEIIPQATKKKGKASEFFEQEAELTSEDEWVGSGDEDERGLDRMEREAGDDDTFHQGALQAELGQIHLRDVLDQDKREVRILQELLFEDGDLGDGHRQRKFRWKNADGEEETGTVPGESSNTQEEEFESEELWRKQRHERETFLRQMNQKESDDTPNVTINRMSIIKANLNAKTAHDSIMDFNIDISNIAPPLLEKKASKDVPSPKKNYAAFQQSFHGSILSRGKSTLARLAALATPLAGDDDVKNVGSNKKNFVFAAINDEDSVEDNKLQKTKRKAEANVGTPRLVKKMRTEDKKQTPTLSLLDHLKV